MKQRKICIVTGTRAEYGLLYGIAKKLKSDKRSKLQIIATGMHLSHEFGSTYKEIEKDFIIDKKIEILLSSDTPVGIAKSMGLAQISFAECYEELKPDLLVVLGDRFEILSAVSAASVAKIPVAHIHGGELTFGSFDDAFRHSITKMSHIHFTSTESYKKRVIQLGESPKNVYNVGALGVENISTIQLLSKEEFEHSINFKLNKKNLLVAFHPATLENDKKQQGFKELLSVLKKLQNTNIIFTKANADTNGRLINQMIDEFTANNRSNCIAFDSLGQKRFLSAMQFIDAVIGNSSSGILEAPSFKIGTINIGSRQKGRIQAESVINCKANKNSIFNAIETLYSRKFQSKLKDIISPYEAKNTSSRIKDILICSDLNDILHKQFFDIRD